MNDLSLPAVVAPTRLVSAAEIRAQINIVQEVMRAVMKDGVHYGTIPGTPKPSLWKAGAEVLCATFRIADDYVVVDLSNDDVVRYRVTCIGVHQPTGIIMGRGLGEASSGEEKYKWRKASRKEFETTPVDRRRVKYGWSRDNGEFEIKQVRTECADLANTILKMANKRAKVAMALNVTAASDIFAQDIEDLPVELQEELAGRHEAPPPREPVRAKSAASAPPADPPAEAPAEPTASPPAPPSMARILGAKMAARGIASDSDRADFFTKHGVVSMETMTIAQGNAMLASLNA